MMNTEIEKIQTAPQYAYLQKKVIKLAGRPPYVPERTMLLMESCGLVSLRLGIINSRILLRENDEMLTALKEMYAPMAACSFGDVPSEDEFLAMPDQDIDLWFREARVINPSNFEWMDAAEKIIHELSEEQLKKKDEKQPKSDLG